LALDKGADLVVVVGLVLRGETPHFDYICQGVTKGVMDVSLSRSKPVGFGVLMCDDLSQAQARAGFADSKEDKGFDAAIAALTLLNN
jgi:6,7-dimethyl-8-ribityllumazine synthase